MPPSSLPGRGDEGEWRAGAGAGGRAYHGAAAGAAFAGVRAAIHEAAR